MKTTLLIFIACVTSFTSIFSQESPSEFDSKGHSLTLNYNLLSRHTAQGAFYGAAGYGTGMWLSGNNVWWGLAGSIVAANIPILLEGRFDEPEVAIGRNLGALSVGIGITVYVELSRKGRLLYTIPYFLRKR